MNKKNLLPIFLVLSFVFPTLLFNACVSKPALELKVEISNATDSAFQDVLIQLDDPEFIANLNDYKSENILAQANDKILPLQLIDLNQDDLLDHALVLCDIDKQEKYIIEFAVDTEQSISFTKRTQAEISVKEGGEWQMVTKENGTQQHEYTGGSFQNIDQLRVPDEHTDHSFYIRYEGPGWESDKVGYRFYLDWRNAVDIFGKKTSEMVLQQVGQDGFDSYHEPQDWGMDILKVGGSLGIGSIGYWNGETALRIAETDSIHCRISQNGIIQSSIETNYFGWKDSGISTNLKSQISIDAGSRLSLQRIKLSEDLDNICTGIVKHANTVLIESSDTGKWSYLASFGKQSLNDDNLGMVIFYRTADKIEIHEDEYSHVLVLKPENKTISYYYAAVWEKDIDQISSQEIFLEYLNKELYYLNNPVTVNYN